jgi:aryl-alcohol dehydrogenase-like predicted oxidoreductase
LSRRSCFDSALVYGYGHTDQLLGELVRTNPGRELFVASKVPPKNREWPARPGDRIRDVFRRITFGPPSRGSSAR